MWLSPKPRAPKQVEVPLSLRDWRMLVGFRQTRRHATEVEPIILAERHDPNTSIPGHHLDVSRNKLS